MSQQLGRGRSRIVYLIVTFSLILSFCTPLFDLPRALAQAPAPEREKAPDVRQTVTPALTLLPTIPAPTPTVAPTVTPEPPAPAPTPDTPNWNNGYVEWGNQYSLLYKGTRYPLSPIGPNRIGRYHAQDDQFLYIERRNSINCGALPCNGVRSTIRPSTGLSGSVTGLSIVWAIPKTPSSPSIRAGVTILIRLWGAPMASLRAI